MKKMTEKKESLPSGAAAPEQTSQDVDVVQMILNDRKRQPINVSEEKGLFLMDAKSFFLDNHKRGAMTMATFKNLLSVLPEQQLQEMRLLLERMKEGASLQFNSLPYGNNDLKHYYVSIRHKRGRVDYRIPAVDNVAIFLVFYMDGKTNINFTMKELYELVKD